MSAKKNELMTFNFQAMKFEPCTHGPKKADGAKANYWETLSEDHQPQVQEIVKAFDALRSTKDNCRKLIDVSTKKEVGVDVLKEKNILLIISGFSKDDIWKLNSIYESEATPNDNYKIVWIIMVKQKSDWTNEVLDTLTRTMKTQRSKKAWYLLPCFSQAASDSKFMSMSKEWQFKNEVIMTVMDIKGKDKVTNIAFRLKITPTAEMNASVSTNPDEKAQKPREHAEKSKEPQKRNYEFYYRGTNGGWNAKFLAKANKVGQDVLIVQLGISVKSFRVSSEKEIKEAKLRLKTVNDPIFLNDTSVSWVVLREEDKVLLSVPGGKMLDVLERFDEQWKKEVEKKGFAKSFMDSYENSSYLD
ncbi:hypothetical protein I3843_16G092600 [Carya illinoinensis]|nr:hypothetical protein I3843_16G092600 [Carya illinoinensis]